MLCLLPAFALSIASVIGFLREPFISFAVNIAHRLRRLNPWNHAHSGYVAPMLAAPAAAWPMDAAFQNSEGHRSPASSAARTDANTATSVQAYRAARACRP